MGKIPMTQIAKLREAKGMTQAELARAIDSDVSTVRNLEKNRSGVQAILRTIKLCQALDCNVEDLIMMVDLDAIAESY